MIYFVIFLWEYWSSESFSSIVICHMFRFTVTFFLALNIFICLSMVALTPRVIFPALFMYHQTLIADCSDFRCFQIKPCMGESLKKKDQNKYPWRQFEKQFWYIHRAQDGTFGEPYGVLKILQNPQNIRPYRSTTNSGVWNKLKREFLPWI